MPATETVVAPSANGTGGAVGSSAPLSALREEMPSIQLAATGLALGGLLLLGLFWALYIHTPAIQPCGNGVGDCPAQLPASMESPLVLTTFAVGYLAVLAAAIIAFPSRLLVAVAALGAAGWTIPSLISVAAGNYGQVSFVFFASFVIGAACHVSLPAIVLRSAIQRLSLGLYAVIAVGAGGLALLVISQLAGDVAPAPLVGSIISIWGFGVVAAAVANQPWKLAH